MAFTVPNRPDTDIQADQAEPDKGDFQHLGDRTSGVLTGGAVTRTATNTVTVGAITGYLEGEYFSISSDTVLNASQPSSGSNAKFVLVLVQKVGGTFSATLLDGTVANGGESATNALYPNYNTATQMPNSMLLAAVYYAIGATDITSASIVDKRVVVLPQANPTVVTSTPGSTVGAIGEIRIDSNMTPATGETRVYVKTDATTWTNLGSASGGGTTTEEVQDIVGAMFTTDASHSGISAVYDDAGGGLDLTGASSWNLTVAGSTENVTDSETVTINVSSDAEVSLSHSNGTITINDEWPRIRTLTHPTLGNTKPAHYLVSDPWGYEWSWLEVASVFGEALLEQFQAETTTAIAKAMPQTGPMRSHGALVNMVYSGPLPGGEFARTSVRGGSCALRDWKRGIRLAGGISNVMGDRDRSDKHAQRRSKRSFGQSREGHAYG